MIQVKSCNPRQEIEPLTTLVCQSFNKPEARVRATLLWKYQHAACFSAVAVSAPQTYVSFYSNLRCDLAYGNQAVSACLCLDMCTHPQYRGRGLITQTSQLVYPQVVNAGISLSYGFSNEQGVQVDKHAHNYGYRVVGQLYSYSLVPLSWHTEAFKLLNTIPVELDHRLPFLHVAKPSRYVQWRYQQKPFARCQCVSLKSDPAKIAILQCSGRQCRIVDIVGDFANAYELAEYLGKVVAFCFHTWHRPVSISVLPNPTWQTVLKQRGVIAIHTRPAPYYLTVKPHLQSLPVDPFDPVNWWVTSGDIL